LFIFICPTDASRARCKGCIGEGIIADMALAGVAPLKQQIVRAGGCARPFQTVICCHMSALLERLDPTTMAGLWFAWAAGGCLAGQGHSSK